MSTFPAGTIVAMLTNSAPPGWFACTGYQLSLTEQQTYPGLAGLLTNNTTPNLAGYALIGSGTVTYPDDPTAISNPYTFGAGNTCGTVGHLLVSKEMPSHQHYGYGDHPTVNGYTWSFGMSSNTTGYLGSGDTDGGNCLYGSSYAGGNVSGNTIDNNNSNTASSVPNSSFSLMQPSIALNFYI